MLAPHAAELVCAAGGCDHIVGVVDYTDFPPQLKGLPRMGNYTAVDVERLLALKPDLVVVWDDGTPKSLIERLQRFGLPLFHSHPRKLDDIPAEIETLGGVLGTQKIATTAARILRAQLAALRRTFNHPPHPKVFYQIWNSPLITVGRDQFISQAIRLCGGRNLFADLSHPAPTVNIETVVRRNPDVILLGGNREKQRLWLKAWQQWPQVTAVRRHWIYPMPADLLQRPGPRLIAGTAILCHALEKTRAQMQPHLRPSSKQ
nr:cobalamin-binding protein [Sulfurivirga sp.]